MANQLSELPWVLDTVSASVLFSGMTKISHIAYVGYTDPSHQAEVQDGEGNLVALLKGSADLLSVTSYAKVGWIKGLKLPTTLSSGGANLPSGKVVVYVC